MKRPESLRSLIEAQVRERLKVLDAALRKVIRTPRHAEPIHAVRVSIRRLMECLRTFAQCFDSHRVKKIRRRLKKLMNLCGGVRNLDIAITLLHEVGAAHRPIAGELRAEHRKAAKDLVRALGRWKGKDIRKRWNQDLAASGNLEGLWRCDESAQANAARVLPELVSGMAEAGRNAARPGKPLAEVHQFRLQVKRLRYTLELFRPVYPKAGLAIDELRELQNRLGAINDCVTAADMVREDPVAARALQSLLRGRRAEFQRYWKQHYGTRGKERWIAALGLPV